MTPAIATTETNARLFEKFSRVRRQSEQLCLPLSARGHDGAVLRGGKPSQVAPGPYHLVFRDIFAARVPPRLPRIQPRPSVGSSTATTTPSPTSRRRSCVPRSRGPPVETILHYRRHVQEGIQRLLASDPPEEAAQRIVLGLHHEQQHQELLATDIKHALWTNPLHPAYVDEPSRWPHFRWENLGPEARQDWVDYEGGLFDIGFAGDGFAFDNELPRHPVYLPPFPTGFEVGFLRGVSGIHERRRLPASGALAGRGLGHSRSRRLESPALLAAAGRCMAGVHDVRRPAPEGIAANAGVPCELFRSRRFCQLGAASGSPTKPSGRSRPRDCRQTETCWMGECCILRRLAEAPAKAPAQMFGDVWEWTQSPYIGYPGYRALPGALGEYNGKFMSSQMVLRGGSVVTPASHIRATYRNFFSPATRWQFSGIRLANI